MSNYIVPYYKPKERYMRELQARTYTKFKKRVRLNRRNRISKPITNVGVMANKRVILRYAMPTRILGATNFDITTWSLNNLYDLDSFLGGQQPRFFDQWSVFFHKYRVNAVKIDLQFATEVPVSPMRFGIGLRDSTTTAPSTQIDMIEDGRMKSRVIDYQSPVQKLSRFVRLHKVVGLTKALYRADEDYTGFCVGPDPAKLIQADICTATLNTGSNIGGYWSGSLTMYCEFFSPKWVGRS